MGKGDEINVKLTLHDSQTNKLSERRRHGLLERLRSGFGVVKNKRNHHIQLNASYSRKKIALTVNIIKSPHSITSTTNGTRMFVLDKAVKMGTNTPKKVQFNQPTVGTIHKHNPWLRRWSFPRCSNREMRSSCWLERYREARLTSICWLNGDLVEAFTTDSSRRQSQGTCHNQKEETSKNKRSDKNKRLFLNGGGVSNFFAVLAWYRLNLLGFPSYR